MKENIIENLRTRYEYYSLRIKLAMREKSRTDRIQYEAKLELVGDLIKEIELKDGKIIDFYPESIETMRKDMEISSIEKHENKKIDKKACIDCGKKLGSMKFNAENGGYRCYSCYDNKD